MGEQVGSVLFWMARLIPIVAVSIFLFVVISSFLSQFPSTLETEASILERIIVDFCLSSDEKNIISLEKMKPDILAQCYKKDKIGFRIKLRDFENKEMLAVNPTEVNPNLAQYFGICQSVKSCSSTNRKSIVKFKNGDIIQTGILETEVISLE